MDDAEPNRLLLCNDPLEVERLSRDVRAISLLLGTEEDYRSRAADELLPGH